MRDRGTRERILEAALALFRERGFDQTTMREIATRAGVAGGLAYYYFASKDDIVLAFYEQAREEMAPRLERAHDEGTLAARLRALIEIKLQYFTPNRRFLGALLGHAADPQHPMSPFGERSRPMREADIAHFARALAGTRTAVPRDLAPHMPKILWFYQMGLLLFWIYDASPGQRRTRQLLEVSLGIVVSLLKLSNLPLLRPARRRVTEIIGILEGQN